MLKQKLEQLVSINDVLRTAEAESLGSVIKQLEETVNFESDIDPDILNNLQPYVENVKKTINLFNTHDACRKDVISELEKLIAAMKQMQQACDLSVLTWVSYTLENDSSYAVIKKAIEELRDTLISLKSNEKHRKSVEMLEESVNEFEKDGDCEKLCNDLQYLIKVFTIDSTRYEITSDMKRAVQEVRTNVEKTINAATPKAKEMFSGLKAIPGKVGESARRSLRDWLLKDDK